MCNEDRLISDLQSGNHKAFKEFYDCYRVRMSVMRCIAIGENG